MGIFNFNPPPPGDEPATGPARTLTPPADAPPAAGGAPSPEPPRPVLPGEPPAPSSDAPAAAGSPHPEPPRPILPSEPPAPPPAVAHDPIEPDPLKTLELKPKLIEALSTVYDPEIPVNIYELGLIYDVDVNADGLVGIRMTLTSPACPAAQTLPGEVKAKAKAVPGVSDAWVDVVWDPQWDMNKMSDAAKLQLGLL